MIRRRTAVLLSVSLVLALAVTCTATALAQSPARPQTTTVTQTPVVNLPTSDLEPVLSSLPVSDLGLDDAEVGQLLSGLSSSPGSHLGQLTGVVSGLLSENSAANLGELVNSLSNQSGLLGTLLQGLLPSLSPAQIFAALSPTQLNELLANLTGGNPLGTLTPEDVSQLLSELTGKLSGEQQESLTAILGGLTAALSGEGLTKFDESLQTLLDGLGESQLAATLGTLDSSQLATVLGELFGSLHDPAQLQPVLDSLLGGLTLAPTTAQSLAGRVGMEQETLVNDLGADSETLPPTAPVLAAAVGSEGAVMGVLKGAKGLAVTLLSPTGLITNEESGENKGSGESKSPGESKGSGENKSSGESKSSGEGNGGGGGNGGNAGDSQGGPGGSGGGTTLIVNLPSTGSPTSTPTKTTVVKKLAKITILSHKVKGTVATILVKVPAAGRLRLSGKGVDTNTRTLRAAERITLRVKLTKAQLASLRTHHSGRLRVKLEASFKPTAGQGSTAAVTVTFA